MLEMLWVSSMMSSICSRFEHSVIFSQIFWLANTVFICLQGKQEGLAKPVAIEKQSKWQFNWVSFKVNSTLVYENNTFHEFMSFC